MRIWNICKDYLNLHIAIEIITYLIGSGNIKLVEEYLIKIYDIMLIRDISKNDIKILNGILYININIYYIFETNNIFNITLLRIISKINQSFKIKCIITLKFKNYVEFFYTNKLKEPINTAYAFIYMIGNTFLESRENIVKKINHKYDLQLIPENFGLI